MKNDEKLRITIPVRMTDSLITEVKSSAQKLELSDQDTLRLLISIGLKVLNKTGYDLPEILADKALKK